MVSDYSKLRNTCNKSLLLRCKWYDLGYFNMCVGQVNWGVVIPFVLHLINMQFKNPNINVTLNFTDYL